MKAAGCKPGRPSNPYIIRNMPKQNLVSMKTIRLLLMIVMLSATTTSNTANAQFPRRYKHVLNETDTAFFKTEEARRIGEQLILYQRVTGGWPKNIDRVRPLSDEQRHIVEQDRLHTDDSTVDNDATTMQMNFLARLYKATRDTVFSNAVERAARYLLSGQYDNGGWPQFWPNPQGYQVHITYNDGNMAHILSTFSLIINRKPPYDTPIITEELRKTVEKAYERGIDCILNTQITVDGKPTVWCQQHDHITLEAAPARAFELPSFCSAESVGLLNVLMDIRQPDRRIQNAVNGAMAWIDKYKLTGLRIERTGRYDDLSNRDTRLVADTAAQPIWARFYDLEHNEPFVCDRDGIPRRRLEDIGVERRTGYAWFTDAPAGLYKTYAKWVRRNNIQNPAKISLATKGSNENGTIIMDRRPTHKDTDYDAVVRSGKSIQKAIEKAPDKPGRPFRIFVHKGLYKQKVIIDKPNIILVGEDRDSTVIRIAETEKTRRIKKYNGRNVHHGTVVLTPEADSCLISGLTIVNDYGTTVEPGNTTHQMAVYGEANHTIIINCNIHADGNDALSLWSKRQDGNEMYYHADLNLSCKGVDFICPRGWCYATRCKFYGDGHAMIWHDGRGDKTKKLVITNSTFDAATPTELGRWHHDSMFYLVNCRLSANVMDKNIHYAYTDKVLDPCPWGPRTYYLYCSREGGHSGWLDNNIEQSEEPGTYHSTTATWTFHGKWDPEAYIRKQWRWVAY